MMSQTGMFPWLNGIGIDNCTFLLLYNFIEGHYAQTLEG